MVVQTTLSHIFKMPLKCIYLMPSLLLQAVCSPCLGHQTLTSTLVPSSLSPSSPPSSQRSSWSNHFSRSKDLLISHLLARPSLSLSSSRMLGCLWFLKHPELSRLRTSVHVISSFNTWARKYQLVTSPFHKLKLEEPFQASGF